MCHNDNDDGYLKVPVVIVCRRALLHASFGEHHGAYGAFGGIMAFMTHIQMDLPFPPSTNELYGHNGRFRYLKAPHKKYRRVIADYLLLRGKPRLEGLLRMVIEVYPPNKLWDIGNFEKCLSDSLEAAGLFENDRQIKEYHAKVHPVTKGGRLLVSLGPLDLAHEKELRE